MRRAFLAALLLASSIRADAPADVDRLNKKIDDFSLPAADGKDWSLSSLKGKKAVVVVFLSFDCPVSSAYSPTLAELHKTYSAKGVGFVGIDASDDLTPAEIAKQAEEFKLPFPVLKDARHKAADLLKAKTAPEAFLLDHNRVLRYRGRIDNAYHARLRKNPRVTDHDLKDAVADLLAGKDVRTPATKAIGCPIPRGEAEAKAGKVTYHRDVLPILQQHCQQCHRAGEVGPFALSTYKQAKNWAQDIKEYTASGKMPPFKANQGMPFHNDRRLGDKDLATLAAWADAGAPEGNPKDAPKPRTFTDGWQLGKPDLVLTVPDDFTLGASGKDAFRCFVLPTGLTEDKHVVAVEVRPGNKRVVHHSLNFFDTSGSARELEREEKERKKKDGEKDAGPGYAVSMGVGFTPAKAGTFGGLGGWAPGQMPRFLPEGYGYPLPKGSDFVLQLHYHRNGREEKDRTSVGLYFAKKKGIKPYKNITMRGSFLFIPAGEADFKVKSGLEVEADCELHSVMPHMHMLGRRIQVFMTPPGGKETVLLGIDDWDYNWQETYFLKEPLKIKKGTRFRLEASFDNSAKNPSNPFNPPRFVIFGEQTDNEMCFVFLGATSDATRSRLPTKPFAVK
ncbi:MAG: redoxin domain-containing protein [Gemmataceae bacterium]|nr:redoxin domain-containing protein [Gemmataceae bacterium]